MKLSRRILTWTALTALMVGCQTQQSDSDVVRKTIHSYQVGVTTFADFKKDAGLQEMEPVSPKSTHSYLNPETDSMDSKMPDSLAFYTTSEKSSWKLLEQGAESSSESHTISGFFSSKPSSSSNKTIKSKFVVGDSKGPVCILIFDGAGKLTEIKPLP